MAKTDVTQLEAKQAAVIFEVIAGQAAQLDRVCFHYGMDGGESSMLELAMLLRTHISNFGVLADLGAQKLGGLRVDDIEGWLLPPVYPRTASDLA